MAGPSNDKLDAVRTALLEWYDLHARDLPWRRRDDPYAIWISEVMLQQTRVGAVGGYYERFLKRFPDVRSLAGASPDDVLKCWEGLGYYSRARNLHRAARMIIGRFDGKLPRDVESLRELPGVGEYTAGAVASIAFGRDEPVLDGNVVRVLCRVFAVSTDPRAARTRRRLGRLARRLIPAGLAGRFNQAMMDLGATVCTPRGPKCLVCPLADHCRARATGRTESLPRKAPAKELPHHTIVAAVVRDRGRILIDRRPPEGLLGGLWEFPGGKVRRGESLPDALRREVREEAGLEVEIGDKLCVVNHAYSHFRITLHAFACRRRSGRAMALEVDAVRWVRPGELRSYAFPRANQRILDALGV